MFLTLDIAVNNGDIMFEETIALNNVFFDILTVDSPTKYLLQQLDLISHTTKGTILFNKAYGLDIPFIYLLLTNIANQQFLNYIEQRITDDIAVSLNRLEELDVQAKYANNTIIIEVNQLIGDDKIKGEIIWHL